MLLPKSRWSFHGGLRILKRDKIDIIPLIAPRGDKKQSVLLDMLLAPRPVEVCAALEASPYKRLENGSLLGASS